MNISDKTKKLLLLISIVTALLAVLVMFMGEGEKVTSLQRPEDASGLKNMNWKLMWTER